MKIIRELEEKLIRKEDTDLTQISIATRTLFERFYNTLGDYKKVKLWERNEKKFYKNKYDLDDDQTNYNINLVRQLNDEANKKRNLNKEEYLWFKDNLKW